MVKQCVVWTINVYMQKYECSNISTSLMLHNLVALLQVKQLLLSFTIIQSIWFFNFTNSNLKYYMICFAWLKARLTHNLKQVEVVGSRPPHQHPSIKLNLVIDAYTIKVGTDVPFLCGVFLLHQYYNDGSKYCHFNIRIGLYFCTSVWINMCPNFSSSV